MRADSAGLLAGRGMTRAVHNGTSTTSFRGEPPVLPQIKESRMIRTLILTLSTTLIALSFTSQGFAVDPRDVEPPAKCRAIADQYAKAFARVEGTTKNLVHAIYHVGEIPDDAGGISEIQEMHTYRDKNPNGAEEYRITFETHRTPGKCSIQIIETDM